MDVIGPIVNYRIEKIANGYILHVTQGKDGPLSKFAFLTKVDLIKHLENVL